MAEFDCTGPKQSIGKSVMTSSVRYSVMSSPTSRFPTKVDDTNVGPGHVTPKDDYTRARPYTAFIPTTNRFSEEVAPSADYYDVDKGEKASIQRRLAQVSRHPGSCGFCCDDVYYSSDSWPLFNEVTCATLRAIAN